MGEQAVEDGLANPLRSFTIGNRGTSSILTDNITNRMLSRKLLILISRNLIW
jgi:hypothetical protein